MSIVHLTDRLVTHAPEDLIPAGTVLDLLTTPPEPDGTEAYTIADDGDDEPTVWHLPGPGRQPVAVIRRCDNPHAFALIHLLLEGDWPNPDDE